MSSEDTVLGAMSSNSGDPADGDVQIAQAAGDGVRDAGRVRLANIFFK